MTTKPKQPCMWRIDCPHPACLLRSTGRAEVPLCLACNAEADRAVVKYRALMLERYGIEPRALNDGRNVSRETLARA